MSRVLLLRAIATAALVGLLSIAPACGTNGSTAVTTETPAWTPTVTIEPGTLGPGSISLPGSIQIFPSIASPWPDMPVLTYVNKYVQVPMGTEFCIGLDADFGLGKSWNLDYDDTRFSLVDSQTAYLDSSSGRLGTQWYHFKTVGPGIGVITGDLLPGATPPGGPASVMHLPFVVEVTG